MELSEQRGRHTSVSEINSSEQDIETSRVDRDTVVENVKSLLTDQIKELDSYMSRQHTPEVYAALTDELEFKQEFLRQLNEGTGFDKIDLSATVIDYADDNDHEPDFSIRDNRLSHAENIEGVFDLIEKLRSVDISVDTSFKVKEYEEADLDEVYKELEAEEERSASLPNLEITREPDSEIAKPAPIFADAEQSPSMAETGDNPHYSMGEEERAAAASYQAELDRSFPDEITSRYYIREDHGGTQRVFADSKGEREVFQDNGEKLRAKSFDAQGVRLMIETAAHRGWTSIEISGSKEFRRETWLEGQAHGISVKGYQPTELDWQDLARREQSYLRNEIVPIEGKELDAAHRDQEQSAGSVQTSKEGKEQTNADNAGTPRSKTVDYKEGVQGILVETGEKPYQDNEKNEPSPFVVIETANGNRTVWGVGLPDALHRAGADIGDEIHLRSTGTERVLKTVIQEIDGQKHRVEQMVDRRAWEANVLEERDRTNEKVEGSKQLDNRVSMEAKAVVRDGETARTDPPQQQVPRLQELEHEQQQKKERDEHER
ncbi:LPD7 domain-containing protein [Brucella anthropi]